MLSTDPRNAAATIADAYVADAARNPRNAAAPMAHGVADAVDAAIDRVASRGEGSGERGYRPTFRPVTLMLLAFLALC